MSFLTWTQSQNGLCVTLYLLTHCYVPGTGQDPIRLKNLLTALWKGVFSMNARELKQFRKHLLRELAEASELVRKDRNDAGEGDAFSTIQDEADMANISHDRAVTNTVTEARANRLRAIEQALESIDRGEYGSCKRCEQDIHIKRLIAMPWVRLCLRCQAELEHGGSTRQVYEVVRFGSEESKDDTLCA
jgi:DnaK suppressor protein